MTFSVGSVQTKLSTRVALPGKAWLIFCPMGQLANWAKSVDLKTILVTFVGLLPALLPAFLTLTIRRKSKRDQLFDRLTKEIAVRDALLKLKLSACQPNSPQQATARELTYKTAERLEVLLTTELERLTSWDELISQWRRVSPAQGFFYEGEKCLSFNSKISWWCWMFLVYLFSICFIFFAIQTLRVPSQLLLARRWTMALASFLLYGGIAIYFAYLGTWYRRWALAIVAREILRKHCQPPVSP
jgi:hypothetical protein